jgi:hypothetical protein
MNLSYFVDRLSKNRGAFEALVRGISVEQARWKPAPDKWSILEVVNHLFDEEREDFRQRLELVLADPTQAWPPIDPPGWVTARGYAERDLETSLDNFLAERQKSLDWLSELSEPNWNNSRDGSNGILSAGDLLASWLAHDFLHLRQLSRLHWQFVGAISEPFQTTYAGPWKES